MHWAFYLRAFITFFVLSFFSFFPFQSAEEFLTVMASGRRPGLGVAAEPVIDRDLQTAKRQDLPATWDWRTEGYVSPVKDQVGLK
jgi:hypothetical protein